MINAADIVVANAERKSAAARAQLMATVGLLRDRLDPRVILAERSEALVGRAQHLLDDAATAVNGRRALSAGSALAFVAAVGLRVWLGRKKSREAAETSAAIDR